MGCPYNAVGMQRASDSAIGLPSSSTSASWMLAFLMPADVRRSLMLRLRVAVQKWCGVETRPTLTNHRWRYEQSKSGALAQVTIRLPGAP